MKRTLDAVGCEGSGEPRGAAAWGVGRTDGRIPAGPHTGAVTGERRVAAGGGVSAQERPASRRRGGVPCLRHHELVIWIGGARKYCGIVGAGDRHLPHAPDNGHGEDGNTQTYPLFLVFHGRPATRAPEISPWRRQWTFSS